MRRLRAEATPNRADARSFARSVEQAALDRRLDHASDRPLAVAFSGGGDSLALLLACLDWARGRGRKVVALTVDHGLEAQSPVWTTRAGEAALKLGAEWRSLTWIGDKPTTGLSAAARDARHRLLSEAAREIGARVILFGHTADDVRESDLIRRDTPSLGWLREWSPSPVWPQGRGVFLLRPLLRTDRSDLRTRLVAEGLTWRDDPANLDARFARARARAALMAREMFGEASAPAEWADGDVDLASARAVSITPDGRLVVARRDISEAARRLLSAALLCASGGTRPSRGQALERLVARLRNASAFKTNLAGARVVADADTVAFAREAGEQARGGLSPLASPIGRPVVFDGRFEIRTAAPGLTVTALAGYGARLDRFDAERLRAYPAYSRPALPVLVDPDGRPSLPAPFGRGAGHARALAGDRFAAACGLVSCEGELDGASAVWRPTDGHPIFSTRE